MRNKFLVSLAIVSLAAIGMFAFAKGDNGQVQVQVQGSSEEVQGQGDVQIQVQTENENGNDENATGTQLQTREENKIHENNGVNGENQNELESTSSEDSTNTDQEVEKAEPVRMAEQVRSEVANAVQQMLDVADRNGGIGEQIRIIAQSQNENQLKIENSIKKIEGRGSVARFVIGPNYAEINNTQQLLDQNKGRIAQLNEMMAQVTNQGDQQKLQNQIAVLEKADIQIQASINDSERGFSLLGWLFRILP